MTSPLPTALAQDAALLRFAVRSGELDMNLPAHGAVRVSQGSVIGNDGSQLGSIDISRSGFVVRDDAGAPISQLSVLGFGVDGSSMSHPAYPGAAWRDRVANEGGVVPASVLASSGSAAAHGDDDDFEPAGSSSTGLVMGVVAALALGGVAFWMFSGGGDDEGVPGELTAEVAAASTDDGVPDPSPAASPSGRAQPEAAGSVSEASAAAATLAADKAGTAAAGDGTPEGAVAAAEQIAADPARAVAAATEEELGSGAIATSVANAATATDAPAASREKSAPASAGAPSTGAAAAKAKPAPKRTVSGQAGAGRYNVMRGDTLSEVAHQRGLRGRTEISGFVEATMRLNGLDDANLIEDGQRLQLPDTAPPPGWVGDLYTAEEYPGF